VIIGQHKVEILWSLVNLNGCPNKSLIRILMRKSMRITNFHNILTRSLFWVVNKKLVLSCVGPYCNLFLFYFEW
jgi:hypothetical protein